MERVTERGGYGEVLRGGEKQREIETFRDDSDSMPSEMDLACIPTCPIGGTIM